MEDTRRKTLGGRKEGHRRIGSDMVALGLEEVELSFDRRVFSDDKTVLLIEEMMHIESRLISDNEIEISNTVCGESETVTVNF